MNDPCIESLKYFSWRLIPLNITAFLPNLPDSFQDNSP